MDQAVTNYIESIKVDWQAEIAAKLRQSVYQAEPTVQERLQYGKPHFLKNGKYLAVLGTAKDWVSFTIFQATAIEAPQGFFEDGPPERKTVKIRQGQNIDYGLVKDLLKQAASTV